MRILYADSLPSQALKNTLQDQGYQVDVADSRYDAMSYALSNGCSCILLGGAEARTCLSELRQSGCVCPILMMTISDSADERIQALNAGADDCLSFPFVMDELLAHIRALLRRPADWRPEQLTLGKLTLDQHQAVLRSGHQEQALSRKEYLLLETLMQHPGMLFSASRLIETVWGNESDMEPDTLWAHISSLRRKIKKLDADVCIQNRRGIGYAILASKK